jgi:hypothetical protein
MSAFHMRTKAPRAACRGVRTIASRIRLAHQLAPHGRALEFFRAIARRYEGEQVHWPAPSLVLRQPWPGVTLRRISYQTHVYLAPHLTLTVQGWRRPHPPNSQPVAGYSPGGPKPRVALRVVTGPIGEVLEGPFALTAVHRLVRRLGARGERNEAGETAAVSGATGSSKTSNAIRNGGNTTLWASLVHPVSRIFRRPAVVTIADGQPTTAERTGAIRDSRSAVARAASHADFQPIDVNRLTDQVIQAIDRRIVAQRERMGRP